MTIQLATPKTQPITSPSGFMIEAHRIWMRAGDFSHNTIRDGCELLYRVDTDLAPQGGLKHALPDELEAWLAGSYRPCPPWATEPEVDWAAWTRATYYHHIRRFYRWATRPGDPWLTYDPSINLRRPRPRKTIPNPATTEQVTICVTEAKEPWRLHCQLAAYGGLRPIEIAALKREDVTRKHIRIEHGKGDKPAVVPCHRRIWAAVEHRPAGHLTRTLRGRKASDHWVSTKTAEYLRETLNVGVSLKQLRSWYATYLLDLGYNIREVQELMRHESVQTTQIYTAVSPSRLEDAIRDLPDLE